MAIRNLPLFVAALIAGASYWIADHSLAPGVAHVVWKGAGVGLLACWTASVARGRDGWLLTTVMAFGAAGDVLLEAAGLVVGAVAFLAGHLVAIVLYRRNRRALTTLSQWLSGAALLIGTPLIGWLLTGDAGVALYATGLGAMAAAAWLSRFPRYRVGMGAVLFVVSDLLIFAQDGLLAGDGARNLLIWPTYFAGQALIAWGVTAALEQDT